MARRGRRLRTRGFQSRRTNRAGLNRVHPRRRRRRPAPLANLAFVRLPLVQERTGYARPKVRIGGSRGPGGDERASNAGDDRDVARDRSASSGDASASSASASSVRSSGDAWVPSPGTGLSGTGGVSSTCSTSESGTGSSSSSSSHRRHRGRRERLHGQLRSLRLGLGLELPPLPVPPLPPRAFQPRTWVRRA